MKHWWNVDNDDATIDTQNYRITGFEGPQPIEVWLSDCKGLYNENEVVMMNE